MKKTYSLRRIGISFIVTAVVFVIQMIIWSNYLLGNISLGLTLLIHAAVIFTLGYFVFMEWCGRSIRITALFVVIMGPFGAAMGLLTLVLYFFYLYYSDPVYSLIQELMPDMKKSSVEQLQERIQAGLEGFQQDTEVISLHEIMQFGNTKQKLVAIEKVLKYYHPEFISALKVAVTDDSNSVRVLAATAISSLEDRFQKKFVKLEKQYKERPDHPETILELAEHSAEYARFDVFDVGRLDKIKHYAVGKFEEYLGYRPDDEEVRFKLASVYMDMEEYEKAEKLLLELTLDADGRGLNQHFKLMELYFKRGEYSKIREFVNRNFDKILHLGDFHIAERKNDILFSWGSSAVLGSLKEVEIEPS